MAGATQPIIIMNIIVNTLIGFAWVVMALYAWTAYELFFKGVLL